MLMKFVKYHALGNDYIVIRPESFPGALSPDAMRLICHRHYGIGSDGILYGPLLEKDTRFPNRTNVQFMKVLNRENIQEEMMSFSIPDGGR